MSRVCLIRYLSYVNQRQFRRDSYAYASQNLSSKIIDGRKLANEILKNLKNEIDKWIHLGNRRPHLSALLVGSNPASELYLKNKARAADECGITSNVITCPTNIREKELIDIVTKLNHDKTVDAILIQLPLPEHIDQNSVIKSISAVKDVDGFTPTNLGHLMINGNGVVPCTALAVNAIIKHLTLPTKGLEATVVGSSDYIGLPIALSLHAPFNPVTRVGSEMTTTLCNVNTSPGSLRHHLLRSDVIVSVTGVAGIIKGDMVKEGAVVIDVGISFVKTESGKVKLLGDVDFKSVIERVSVMTKVPGGVGPVTVAMLMHNTFLCATACQPRSLSASSQPNKPTTTVI